MRNIRFTIPWKIGIGFGVFVAITGVLFTLTNNTLREFRATNDQINSIYSPAIEEAENLARQITFSKMLIRYWGTVQSRDDDVEKTQLRALMNEEVPQQLQKLEQLGSSWTEENQLVFDSLRHSIDQLFIVYEEITHLLPDFNSYMDPTARMQVEYLMLPEEGIDKYGKIVDAQLARLTADQRKKLLDSTVKMNLAGDRLRFLAGNISIFILVFGVVIAILVSRSIVKPITALKRTLLYLGKGIYPKGTMEVTPDEIGDMAFAVNRLVDGLRKTREFSAQVGKGNFEVTYSPLSEDDELGFALLKMRDDLAQNERQLERKVEERTNEVVRQKEEIERQRNRVTELYKDLTDSINYAKRLQQTILPRKENILEMFPDSFVFYRPRDIVSGDFYWFKQAGSKKMFAAVDCTGHGVPGAFMSLVGHNVLNQVTKVFTRPSQILDNLNRLSAQALQSESNGNSHLNDGMDLAIVVLDPQAMKLEYSGAYNPLYVIREGELIQLDPDKFSIGSFHSGEKQYTNRSFDLQKGDAVYAFTDGYVDQFGGEKGKKFLKKRFRELLLEIHALPMEQQEQKLHETLVTWKKGHEQVDDILVIGIRV